MELRTEHIALPDRRRDRAPVIGPRDRRRPVVAGVAVREIDIVAIDEAAAGIGETDFLAGLSLGKQIWAMMTAES